MRILHTSDWHLGRALHEQSLLQDQEAFIQEILAHLSEQAYDVMLIAGDIFDRSIPSEDAVKLWNNFLEGFCDLTRPPVLCVIAGNHDSAARLSMASKVVERAGIYIRGGTGRIEEPVCAVDQAGKMVRIWLLPFLTGGSLTRDEDGEKEYLLTQEAALGEAVRRIKANFSDQDQNVLVAHCFVAGSRVAESERTLVGTAAQVSSSLFEGFDYVALGHLHRPQVLRGNMAYSGSPLAYSFSEAGQDKSLLSVTLSPGHPPVLEPIPLSCLHPMKDLHATMEDLLNPKKFLGLESTYLRVCLTETTVLSNPVARLRSRFPLLLEFRERFEAPATTGAPPTADDAESQDIGEEFEAFEYRIRGEEVPPGLVSAFSTLLADHERQGAQ